MTTIDPLNNGDSGLSFRNKLNSNFDNLNNDKLESSDYNAADVKSKYESNANTNAFTDAEQSKLASIDSGAQVNTLNDVIAGSNVTIDKTDPLNPVISSTGEGDMKKATYDPQLIEADAFDRGNHNGASSAKKMATISDPASGAINTAIIDANDGIIITTNTDGVDQVLGSPTDTTAGKTFIVINDNSSTDPILINGNPIQVSELVVMVWEGNEWTTEPLGLAQKGLIGTFVHTGLETIATIGGTTFDLNPGVAYIVDNYTNPDVPKVTRVDYPGSTGNVITNLNTELVTYLSLDVNGNIIQSSTNTWGDLDRENARLGTITHQNLSSITAFDSVTHGIGWDIANALGDLTRAIGIMILNNTDFAFSAASNNMTIARSSGTAMGFGINRTNRKNPNNLPVAGENPVLNFLTSFRDGLGGFTLNSINSSVTSGVYDDGTGGTTVPNGNVGNNSWVNHRFYYSPDLNLIALAYGQNTYSTQQDALNSLSTESHDQNPLFANTLFRGWLTLKGNASDLSNTAQGVFTTATKFGATGGSGTTSAVTNQDTYENSTQPQVITDATRNAMVTQNGEGDDTSNTSEWKNNAGTIVAKIRGDGVPTIGTDLVTKDYGDANYLGSGTDPNAIHDNVAGEIAAITEKASPVSGDVIIIEDSADSNNKKKVQIGNLPGGGGGESNTASNVGTAGVGVFKQKTGVDLEFKKLNAGSSKVTVTDDTLNSEIDIDVDEGNISHLNIADIGTNSHTQIDSHIASTANPHSVTATQVGLGNVDNTSDANKPVSTATQTALDGKLSLDGTDTMTGNLAMGGNNIVGGAGVAITGSYTGTDYNGVALTTAGGGTLFLADDGVYKAAGDGGGAVSVLNTFTQAGTIVSGTYGTWTSGQAGTISEVNASYLIAPTGTSATVEVFKNDVSIGTITIASGEGSQTTFSDTILAKYDKISYTVTEGGTIAGSSISINFLVS